MSARCVDNAGIPPLSRGNADLNQTNAFCTELPCGALAVELLCLFCLTLTMKMCTCEDIYILAMETNIQIALSFRDLLNSCYLN